MASNKYTVRASPSPASSQSPSPAPSPSNRAKMAGGAGGGAAGERKSSLTAGRVTGSGASPSPPPQSQHLLAAPPPGASAALSTVARVSPPPTAMSTATAAHIPSSEGGVDTIITVSSPSAPPSPPRTPTRRHSPQFAPVPSPLPHVAPLSPSGVEPITPPSPASASNAAANGGMYSPAHKASGSADSGAGSRAVSRAGSSQAGKRNSPNPSPRPSAIQRQPSSSPTRLSAKAARALSAGGVLDWRPFDSTRVGVAVAGSAAAGAAKNVETIFAPELEARREEVARRKAEAERAQKSRFAAQQSEIAGQPQSSPPALPRSPSLAPVGSSGPSSPISPSAHPAPPSPSLMSMAGTGQRTARGTSPMPRRIPNARTTPNYDIAGDLYGGTTDEKEPKQTIKAGRFEFDEGKGRKRADSIDVLSAADSSKPRSPTSTSSSSSSSSPLTAHEVRMRQSPLPCWPSRRPPPLVPQIYRLLEHSAPYLYCSIACSVISLFAFDFTFAFLPKQCDIGMSALLCALLVLFSLELLLNSYAKENYLFRSFDFWLDLLGTFSLCFDISFIADAWFPSSDYGGSLDANATSGGTFSTGSNPAGTSAARSASILRLARFARLIRLLKLVRLVRLFKFHSALTKTAAGFASATPSKVGLTLSERSDRRIVGLVILLLIAQPLLQASPVEDVSGQMGLQLLTQGASEAGALDATLREAQIRTYITYQSENGNMLFLLSLAEPAGLGGGTKVWLDDDAAGKSDSLRSGEIYSFHMVSQSGDASVALFSQRDFVFWDSLYNILFTLLVIVAMAASSALTQRDVHRLVVQPLDRMTSMVHKLAGTLLFFQHTPDDADTAAAAGSHQYAIDSRSGLLRPGWSGPRAGEIRAFETDALEEVLASIGRIFDPKPDPHLPKGLAMLSGSKSTQIKHLHKVVCVDVSERPRQPGEDGDFDDTAADIVAGGDQASSTRVSTGSETSSSASHRAPTLADFPEASSIQSILHHSALLPYFKLYLTSTLSLENLLLVQEVERFRTIVKLHALNIHNAFISVHAANQVNLPSVARDRILAQLEQPNCDMFNEAAEECTKLMSGFLKPFQASRFFMRYMQTHAARARHASVNNSSTASHAAPAPIISHNPPPSSSTRLGVPPSRNPKRASDTVRPALLSPPGADDGGSNRNGSGENGTGSRRMFAARGSGGAAQTASLSLTFSPHPSPATTAAHSAAQSLDLPGSVPSTPSVAQRREQSVVSMHPPPSSPMVAFMDSSSAAAAGGNGASAAAAARRPSERLVTAPGIAPGLTAEQQLDAQISALVDAEAPHAREMQRESGHARRGTFDSRRRTGGSGADTARALASMVELGKTGAMPAAASAAATLSAPNASKSPSPPATKPSTPSPPHASPK